MTPWKTFPVEFGGGLISNVSPLQQGVNAVGSATLLQNFEPSKEGGYKKVLGFEKFLSGAISGSGPILGLKIVDSSTVVAARENALNVTEYWVSSGASWASLGSATSLGGKVSATVFNFDGTPRLFMVDGTNSPAIYETSGGTLSFPAGYPSDVVGADFVATYESTIFVAKDHTLSFSAPYDYTDFSPANGGGTIGIGEDITGLRVFRQQLIVFSKNKVQRITGSSISDFKLEPITEDIGCIDGDTIQEIGGDIIFLAPDGLRLLSATDRIGDFGLNVASFPIEETAKDFVNNSTSFSSVVIRGKAQYRIFGYTSSTSAETSEGLLMTKFSDQGAQRLEWATTKGIKAYIADSRYTTSSELVVFANADGYIYKLESGSSFDGEPIDAIYESPFMPIDDPNLRKTLYKMTLYTDITGIFNVSVDLSFDMYKVKNYNTEVLPETINLASNNTGVSIYGSPSMIWGTSTWGSELDQVYNTPVIGSGKTFSFRIEDNSTNPSFSLDTALFEYRTFDRK